MKPPFPSYVQTWHNAPYDGISPTQPSLSAAGKTVIVTGGGRGIGLGIVRAFAEAGASHIAIIGRSQETLEEAKKQISNDFEKVKITTHACSASSETQMAEVAKSIGAWDVLVPNAGVAGNLKPLKDADISDWWNVFETNVKGLMVTALSFLPYRKPGASVLGVSAGSVCLPPGERPGGSAYNTSKLAQVRALECLAGECPDLHVVNVHPGIVKTQLVEKFPEGVPLDDVRLPGNFMVWAASPEARFLRGKTVWANWDKDELIARSERISSSLDLTSNMLGWPFKPEDSASGPSSAKQEQKVDFERGI